MRKKVCKCAYVIYGWPPSWLRDHSYITSVKKDWVGGVGKKAIFADIQYCIYADRKIPKIC